MERVLKALKYKLLKMLIKKYDQLTETETKQLVIEEKWFSILATRLDSEMQQRSQNLTTRVSELAERYEQTLSAFDSDIDDLKEKVKKHLALMEFEYVLIPSWLSMLYQVFISLGLDTVSIDYQFITMQI